MSSYSPDNIELHRPFIDAVTIKCPDCGGEMHRVPEVIDCWYDSGSMPFAQHHYPFENKDLFEAQFPADFISEAVDQTRGWFYSLLAISTLIFNKAPYKNVIVLGHVQDENGQKMSKSKGNAVDPFDALEKYGADAIRWYFYTNSAPWLPNRFHDKAVVEGQRKFLGTLWNTYAFYVLYAEIDQFDPTKHTLNRDTLSVMDKWLLSKLNSTIKATDANLAAYKIPEAAKALSDFTDELSNWYVRRCRDRYWGSEMTTDKENAYMTLYTALVTLSKLAAPMIPFMTEEIYQNLVRSLDPTAPESIHLCDYPVADETLIDETLEYAMEEVLHIVILGRAARNAANIKNRQPIGKMFIGAPKALDATFTAIITDELNVKEAEFTTDATAFLSYNIKPNLKTVGPKYGKQLGEIRSMLAAADGTALKRELDATGKVTLETASGKVELTEEDLLIETVQGGRYVSLTEGGVTVALDTRLDDALIEEGFVREIISKVQTMRKEAGFDVTDHITLYEEGSEKLRAIIDSHAAEIRTAVLCDLIVFGVVEGYTKEWDINGESVTLAVKKDDAK